MVAPRYRSRTLRRVFVKTPGGRTVLHHVKRKPAKAKCAKCSAVLSGIPNVRAKRLHSMPKTAKRPQRPYGGMFCTQCSREAMISKARTIAIQLEQSSKHN